MSCMQLRIARLCLNCEEIHSAAHCPICASESFAYLSRWIPPEDRRPDRSRMSPEALTQQQGRARWAKRGAAGVAVLAATRLLWQISRPVEWTSPEIPDDVDPSNPRRDRE